MAVFHYKALDKDGLKQKGSLEADNAKQARQQLRAKGWLPVEVDVQSHAHASGQTGVAANSMRISRRALTLFTRQLSTLLEGGIPLEQALRLMARQHEKQQIKNLVIALASQVSEGHSLAVSMAKFPRVFSEIYRASVAAGEHAGCLDQSLTRLAVYSETNQKNMEKIQLSLLYPMILSVAAFLAVSFLLVYVMPNLVRVFEDSKQQLPMLTILLMKFSRFAAQYGGYALLAFLAMLAVFALALRAPKMRYALDKKLFQLPLLGKFAGTLNICNFLRTFCTLHRNGVPIVQAITMSSKAVRNLYLREKFEKAAQHVKEGRSLQAALEEVEFFPPTALYMIASGESSGKLDDMLERAASDQEFSLQTKVSYLVGLFEPAMIVVMGAVVLTFVLAIMLPILNFNQVIK